MWQSDSPRSFVGLTPSGSASLPDHKPNALFGTSRGLPSSRCLSAHIPRPVKTPTAPPESHPRPTPRQALRRTSRFLCVGFQYQETVADRFIIIDEAALDFGECGLPCGLRASLCTLHMFCSTIALSGRYLRHMRNTRYGWRAKPYPMGTFTPQEASNFLALLALNLNPLAPKQGNWSEYCEYPSAILSDQ